MKNILLGAILVGLLGGCTWDTYRDKDGKMHVSQRYPNGTSVYYTNGSASQNTRYNDARPVQHAILPDAE